MKYVRIVALSPKDKKYNSIVLNLVKKEIPMIQRSTPQDFWDTVNYFRNSGLDPKEAAEKLIKTYK